jgi:hypothetical protein
MGLYVPYTVVFLWMGLSLGPQGGQSPARTETTPIRAKLDELYDYGAARGIDFVPLTLPSGAASAGLPAYDAALADRLEAELEQARTARAALEEQAAAERLERVTAELLAHQHLPQAAFLMAECLALQAQAASGAANLELWRQSTVLGGPRAPAFGEAIATTTAGPGAELEVAIVGPAAGDELELDGQRRGSLRSLRLAPGLHHVRVLRAGRLVFAAFERLAADQRQLALAVPRVQACSYDDLASVDRARAAQGVRHDPPVQCARWALVRPEPGGVGVASCGRDGCGPFVHWQRRRASAPFTPLPVDSGRLPSWAGFALAGAGAALATSLVLWQSGALDRGQRAATTLEWGGIDP